MDERSIGSRRHALSKLVTAGGAAWIVSTVGCTKMIVATGKLLYGDPKLTAEFTTLAKEDLSKGTKTVLIACATTEAVDAEAAGLKLDLIDGITRRMNRNGVKTIKPELVADWVDDHGGVNVDANEMAHDFDADYLACIDVQTFSLHEPNSPKMLRGSTSGYIHVFKVDGEGSSRMARKVYQREFALTYPQHQPLSEQTRSTSMFHKDYIDELCEMLAERFYDHRPGNKF